MAMVMACGLAVGLTAGVGLASVGFDEVAKLIPTTTATGGRFGTSVDIAGDVMIVGAPYQEVDGTYPIGPGYAQVGVFSDWDGSIAETIELSASDGQTGDYFGWRVAIGNITGATEEGGVAYVSSFNRADGEVPSAGAVYLFTSGEGDAITETAILTASGEAAGRGFGTSLSFDGSSLAVGAIYDSAHGVLNGAAYVLTLGLDGQPTHEERIECDDPTDQQYFGWDISIDGDRLAVSAAVDSIDQYLGGAVYIFDRQSDESWTQTAVVTPAGLSSSDWFGTSVVVHEDLLIVGAINYDEGEGDDLVQNVGMVYVFEWDGMAYQEVQQIPSPLVEPGIFWGTSLDFDGNNLLIGCNYWRNDGTFGTGAAAAYEYGPDDLFIGGRVFIGSDVSGLGHFGSAVAFDGERVVIGAIETSDGTGGAVYVFTPGCSGDTNYNGQIDSEDVLDLVTSWGDTGITKQDVQQDFEVGIHDLLTVLQYYGSCE